eukprot:Opistho-2@53300
MCPFRVLLVLFTVLSAFLVGYSQWGAASEPVNDGVAFEAIKTADKKSGRAKRRADKRAVTAPRSTLKRVGYGILTVVIILFHIELLTGGFLCSAIKRAPHSWMSLAGSPSLPIASA